MTKQACINFKNILEMGVIHIFESGTIGLKHFAYLTTFQYILFIYFLQNV